MNTPPWSRALRVRWRRWHLSILFVASLVVLLVAADSAIAQQGQYATGGTMAGCCIAQADPVAAAVGDPTNWLDITSRVGVVAMALLGGWLWLTGRIYTKSAVEEIKAGHAKEVAALSRRLADALEHDEELIADRDAWKLAAGNALEGIGLFERSAANTLGQETLVATLVDTIREIAQGKGASSG